MAAKADSGVFSRAMSRGAGEFFVDSGVLSGVDRAAVSGAAVSSATATHASAPQPAEVLLQVRQLRVRTAAGALLLRVPELTVRSGQVVALIGDSGAGKSLLAKAAVGLLPPGLLVAAESRLLCGQEVTGATAAGLRTAYLGYVNQDAQSSMDPLRSVGNAVLEQPRTQLRGAAQALRAARGLRGSARTGLRQGRQTAAAQAAWFATAARQPRAVRQKLLQQTALRALHYAGFQGLDEGGRKALLRSKPGELSGGMRQRALLAAALSSNPRMLVADEPTSALDPHISAQVLRELVAAGRQRGLLLISHDLAAVRQHADYIYVLSGGAVVESGSTAQVFAAPQHEVTRALVAAAGAQRCGVSPGVGAPGVGEGNNNAAEMDPLTTNCAAAVVKHTVSAPSPQGGGGGYSYRIGQAGYRRSKPIVQNIALEIPAGHCAALIGASGSGKSTAAKALLGLVPHVSGVQLPQQVRLGWVPQDTRSSLLPWLRVQQVLREAGCRTAAEVTALLQAVELTAPPTQRVSQLSGGQVQRLAIARALARKPQLLVLDEPVSALDSTVRQAVIQLLQRLRRQQQLALLLISHEMQSVAQLADTVYVFEEGQIVEQGQTATVFAEPKSRAAQQILLEYTQCDEPAITGEHSEEQSRHRTAA